MAPKAEQVGTTQRRLGCGLAPAEVGLGLLSTEVVLRGGFLLEPVIIGGCKVSDGRVFMPLLKGDSRLSNILTDEQGHKRPLSRTLVFETIQKLRPHNPYDITHQSFASPDKKQKTHTTQRQERLHYVRRGGGRARRGGGLRRGVGSSAGWRRRSPDAQAPHTLREGPASLDRNCPSEARL